MSTGRLSLGRASAALAGAMLLPVGCKSAPTADLVLRGATLIDGTGAPVRRADVAVTGRHILAVGDLGDWVGRQEIDASGKVLAPGFIDMHSHADLVLLGDRTTQERLLAAKIAQGVTTVIVGNCGLGAAPASPAAADLLSTINGWMTPDGVVAEALGIADYLALLEQRGIVLNAGTLVPHGPLRISACGLRAGEPSDAERSAMRDGLDRGLAEGAFGLSAGLIYPPGMYSSTDELVALAEVVAAHGGLFAVHVRGSSETLEPATRELVEIAERSGARTHHSHLEAVGERFWDSIATVLRLEDKARARGVRLSHDVFPYTRAATMMTAIFPPWALEGGIPALSARLRDPETRARIGHEIEHRVPEWPPWRPGGWPHNLVGAVGWDDIVVASVGSEGSTAQIGRSLADLARETGQAPLDAIAELMLAEDGRVGQLVGEITGDDGLRRILSHPAAAVVSDAEDYGRGLPHPAHAGAFARTLRLEREGGWLGLPELVRRLTGYPAALVGLEDRGVVRPGAFADLVVFDADAVRDTADWEQPRRRAEGIDWVLINGRVVVERGRYRGGLAGTVLRSCGK